MGSVIQTGDRVWGKAADFELTTHNSGTDRTLFIQQSRISEFDVYIRIDPYDNLFMTADEVKELIITLKYMLMQQGVNIDDC